jgi:hypothetical protein
MVIPASWRAAARRATDAKNDDGCETVHSRAHGCRVPMRHRKPTGAPPMSNLTALKLQRELKLTRDAMAASAARPALVMHWTLDPQTGRPVGVWTAQAATVTETAAVAITLETSLA